MGEGAPHSLGWLLRSWLLMRPLPPAGQIFNVQSLTKKKCHINALYIYCDLQITLTVHRYISTCAKKKKLVVVGPVLWSGVSTPRVVC